ncbi:MAG: hypothetical protein NC123_03455 [Butyrivibrio sp.]|nr:hypothetical protein [Acetatifactor muris]MCM1558593.1 hypothetical protein [Butyrivibrio sp.]
MGLFSKKPTIPEYDEADCRRKKERMRELFNGEVEDGDTYNVLHATQHTYKFERGFVTNTNTTTFYHYILGYRPEDQKVVLVQTDVELTHCSDAFYVDMDSIVNVSYDPKIKMACLQYPKGHSSYGELLYLDDNGSKTMAGMPNMVQPREREAFLDFLESVRSRLAQQGKKLDKWKR